jgi:hypothetical protein
MGLCALTTRWKVFVSSMGKLLRPRYLSQCKINGLAVTEREIYESPSTVAQLHTNLTHPL